jgi:hypothetical protein
MLFASYAEWLDAACGSRLGQLPGPIGLGNRGAQHPYNVLALSMRTSAQNK